MMDERLAWKLAVTRHGCLVHDNPADCDGPVQAHHVITQQALRKHGHTDRLWDAANGVAVCEKAHRRHTLAVERIPYGRLPQAAVVFAEGLGLGWMLDRYYRKDAA